MTKIKLSWGYRTVIAHFLNEKLEFKLWNLLDTLFTKDAARPPVVTKTKSKYSAALWPKKLKSGKWPKRQWSYSVNLRTNCIFAVESPWPRICPINFNTFGSQNNFQFCRYHGIWGAWFSLMTPMSLFLEDGPQIQGYNLLLSKYVGVYFFEPSQWI